ncbi:MAG: hypothetical protein EOP52_11210 [Sphingobacteriales bacterium]|nr:MAG: hypothetical protein EOP52_11210 [Sphingobacteriales bacterium]
MMRRPFFRFSASSVAAAVLLWVLGAAFLLSAFGKFQSIDSFSWAILDAGIRSDSAAAVLARLLVGLEAAVGFLLLLRVAVRRLALPVATGLLLFFSGYLMYLLVQQGNAGDCGCFGDLLPMKPLPALLKNAAMLLGVVVLYKLPDWKEWQRRLWIGGLLIAGMTVVPLMVLPSYRHREPMQLTLLQDSSLDLRHGKQVVAFLSLGCPHCRHAAQKFSAFFRKDPTLPLTMVLNGSKEEALGFFQDTKATNVPVLYEPDQEVFVMLAGKWVPSVYYVNNGIIERRVSYNTLTAEGIRRWAVH